jgi:hypothetical protein
MSLYIVDYSEKAIAIFGDTKYYKNKLNEIQGKFNASLNFKNENGETEKKAGWIFPKVRKDMVKQVINDINSGKIEKEHSLSNKSKENTRDENKNSSFESSSNRSEEKTKESSNRDYVNISSLKEELFKDFVPKRDFMNLVSKIEKLEQELFILKNKSNSSILNNSNSSILNNSNSKNQDNKDYEEELEDDYEEEKKPKKSLLRGKK